MKVKDLSQLFQTVNIGDGEREIGDVFCCDLLSVAMGKAPSGCAWVTVMSNINTLAVASLADVSAVILAEGAAADPSLTAKAAEQGISVFRTGEPVFRAALSVYSRLPQ